MNDYELRGAVGESSNGSMGIIYAQRQMKNGEYVWIGMSFNGNPWSSRRPKIHAYTLQEYINNEVEDKISIERKSYLDAIRRLKKDKTDEAAQAIAETVNIINERASKRRDLRQLAPITKAQQGLVSHDSGVFEISLNSEENSGLSDSVAISNNVKKTIENKSAKSYKQEENIFNIKTLADLSNTEDDLTISEDSLEDTNFPSSMKDNAWTT